LLVEIAPAAGSTRGPADRALAFERSSGRLAMMQVNGTAKAERG